MVFSFLSENRYVSVAGTVISMRLIVNISNLKKCPIIGLKLNRKNSRYNCIGYCQYMRKPLETVDIIIKKLTLFVAL